jgi:hypothetical protein
VARTLTRGPRCGSTGSAGAIRTRVFK